VQRVEGSALSSERKRESRPTQSFTAAGRVRWRERRGKGGGWEGVGAGGWEGGGAGPLLVRVRWQGPLTGPLFGA
jgi:hypothetical protein